jgi:hypothetical protein
MKEQKVFILGGGFVAIEAGGPLWEKSFHTSRVELSVADLRAGGWRVQTGDEEAPS